jgi:hypothetical protein
VHGMHRTRKSKKPHFFAALIPLPFSLFCLQQVEDLSILATKEMVNRANSDDSKAVWISWQFFLGCNEKVKGFHKWRFSEKSALKKFCKNPVESIDLLIFFLIYLTEHPL